MSLASNSGGRSSADSPPYDSSESTVKSAAFPLLGGRSPCFCHQLLLPSQPKPGLLQPKPSARGSFCFFLRRSLLQVGSMISSSASSAEGSCPSGSVALLAIEPAERCNLHRSQSSSPDLH
ncbi:hypothetical protein MUK42_11283 [Musa troglodytarum]|uniref:Uncharacterized protein n=1 Tax=Musa troglodytarum TaxID=320322 RepID=A0A9E7HVB1_9LILI|nr:hypothetical protein MUK42_11283 [Musa troglodytarum]